MRLPAHCVTSQLKICFVCHEYPPATHGGIGAFAQVLGRALVRAGHHVRVIGMGTAASEEEDEGVCVYRLPTDSGRYGWIRNRWRLFQRIAAWSARGEIDLIEVPDWEGWAACWPSLRVPVVVRVHGSISYFASEQGLPVGRRAFWIERASLRRADSWCAVSRYAAERTRELFTLRNPPDRVLYNCVEHMVSEEEFPRSRQTVVFVGTLAARKGIAQLIEAWPMVVRVCPAAELHIIGKDGRAEGGGSMRAALIARLPKEAKVHFHGHLTRAETLRFFQRARVAVFPSYAEAFALAPLEAMACQCPTIYSQRGSGPELIEDGKNGLLIDPACPEQIAAAIIRLLADDELAQRLGQEGKRAVVDRFALAIAVEQNEAFYRDVIANFER